MEKVKNAVILDVMLDDMLLCSVLYSDVCMRPLTMGPFSLMFGFFKYI